MVKEARRFARELRKSQTSAEDVLWQALRARRFLGLKFKRQVPILAYTVDFFCFDRKLAIEIDGKQHNIHQDYDRRRTEEIETQGFTVLRFGNWDVLNDLDGVLRRIAAAARAPGTPGGSPSPLPLSHSGEGDIRAGDDSGHAS